MRALSVAVVAAVLTLVIYFTSASTGGSGALSVAPGHLHVLVTGGAGFIGSHAILRLLEEGHTVTTIDNLSRGNRGAIDVIREFAPRGKFSYVQADLGRADEVAGLFSQPGAPKVDLVIHFAAVAYVGESVAEPLRYYHNITSNTMLLLEEMKAAGVERLVYSSTCATYGNPETLPITEATPTEPINPYGRSKLMAENIIRDFAKANKGFNAAILRYFNVFGSDPQGRLGEAPRAELRHHGRISGACFDAALGFIDHLTIMGTDFPTHDGTCVRDFIHVTDLVDAHIAVMPHLANPPTLYNVGTGKGYSVKEFVEACKAVTKRDIDVVEQRESRPGDYAEVYADVSKINTEIGWKAKYTNLEESLGHAWRWRSQHKQGYARMH